MITYRKVKALLKPGDTVFTTNGSRLFRAVVLRIENSYLYTNLDVLHYEDHGTLWWLTERVAKEKIQEIYG